MSPILLVTDGRKRVRNLFVNANDVEPPIELTTPHTATIVITVGEKRKRGAKDMAAIICAVIVGEILLTSNAIVISSERETIEKDE